VIKRLSPEDWRVLQSLYRLVTARLRKEGVKQWDFFYPNVFVIREDLRLGNMFGIRDEQEELIGAIVVDHKQSSQYATLPWQDSTGNPAVIHRLVVHPTHQGKGIGKQLLHFAEEYAKMAGSTSIRLDVYSGNPGAVALYENRGYLRVGEVRYPLRKLPYWCMEKLL